MAATAAMNRLKFDTCTYQHDLTQAVGPGRYMLDPLRPHCQPCLQDDARVSTGYTGASECITPSIIDVESDLINLTRKATGCPTGQYQAGTPPCPLNASAQCLARPRALPTEDTRLNNPPCTLRGTGWNRWEWLCQDPQHNALVPFGINVATSIVVKDNHRPVLPKPIDQTLALPRGDLCASVDWIPRGCDGKPVPQDDAPTLHWRSCSELERIRDGCGGRRDRANTLLPQAYTQVRPPGCTANSPSCPRPSQGYY
jgi:hypothetical protein